MSSRLRSLALVAVVLMLGGCGAASHVHLAVQPKTGLRDAPLNIRVTGLKPGERVSFRSEEDAPNGTLWRATTKKRANGAGMIVIKASLLQALAHPVGPWNAEKDPFPGIRSTVTVSVLRGSHVVAAAKVVRSLRPAGLRITPERPSAVGFYGNWVVPKRVTGVPVLIFGGSEGGLSVDREAWMLAAYGHPVLALAYFDEPGLPKELRDIPLEYFRRALAWERRQPAAHGRRIVVDGASYGGEAALLVGASYPTLVGGVVALTPYDFTSGVYGPNSAWSLHGKPIPSAEEIPVTKIAGPVFAAGSFGDDLWSSGQAVKDIGYELRGHRPKPTLLVFQKAGHRFNGVLPNTPTVVGTLRTRYGLERYGGTRVANELAQRKTWHELVPWLARLG